MIWVYIIACIPILGIAFVLWHSERNEAVFRFRTELIDMASDAAIRILFDGGKEWHKPYDIVERYSYDRMLYSLRPLKLEAWFTEEEIKILTGR